MTACFKAHRWPLTPRRSEEHTSELQSQSNLVCRLLLEKKNICRAKHHHPALHPLNTRITHSVSYSKARTSHSLPKLRVLQTLHLPTSHDDFALHTHNQ